MNAVIGWLIASGAQVTALTDTTLRGYGFSPVSGGDIILPQLSYICNLTGSTTATLYSKER